MEYRKLPPVREGQSLELGHFPSRFHAAVFRLWETVDADKIAKAVNADVDIVIKAAADMGLEGQKYTDRWTRLGYITTIRNAWHILPYNQILTLLDWSEDKLATVLKEDDFLEIKLGRFKPYCDEVFPEELNEAQQLKLNKIKNIMQEHFDGFFDGAEPFDFFETDEFGWGSDSYSSSDGLKMIYSYCGLYAGVLDNDISISYPDKLLKMYQSSGINAVWLPVVLYQLIPFPFDESYSVGWEQRQERLKELVKKAGEFGIKVYLYLNEPRCMPLEFFEKHPELLGGTNKLYGALCTGIPEVMKYLRNSVRMLCEAVPDIGGFFSINCSENLTHCKSNRTTKECERCKDVSTPELIAGVLCAISEESRKVNPDIRTIAWTWAWSNYMTDEEIKKCIDLLPKEIIIQCSSEMDNYVTIGGVDIFVNEYSLSIPGPSPVTESIWNYARSKGHEVCAKVQVNVTWECSTLPFLPVFDLIREHMTGLKNADVKHLMLSWTLGGCPSVNLKIASSCLEDPSEERYMLLLREEFGEYAEDVKKASEIFSEAFREYPFHSQSLYFGPHNLGPANLLYVKPSGFKATMTCYAYDDIENWLCSYPKDVYIEQFRKVSEGWRKGLEVIENMPDCEFKRAAWGGYALFYSSYLQSEFVDKRDSGDVEYLSRLVEEEKKLALLMYELMRKSSLLGYEAANHYYFNKGMLAEKVINCDYVLDYISKK